MRCTCTSTLGRGGDGGGGGGGGETEEEEEEWEGADACAGSINNALSNGNLDAVQLADTGPVENRSFLSQAVSLLPSSLKHLLPFAPGKKISATKRHLLRHPHPPAGFSLEGKDDEGSREEARGSERRRRRRQHQPERVGGGYPYTSRGGRGMQFCRYEIDDRLDRCLDV